MLVSLSSNLMGDVQLGSQTVPNEMSYGIGAFIAPNENHTFNFLPSLAKTNGGVLISVGTFRTLTDAGLGNFNHVFMVDADPVTQLFNQLNLRAISTSKNRIEYLETLFQFQLSSTEKKKIASGDANGVLTGVLKKLSEKSNKWDHLDHTKFDWGKVCGLRCDSILNDLLAKSIQIIENPTIARVNFLGSDEIFENAKKVIMNGKVQILTANLAGEFSGSFSQLCSLLRDKNLKVARIDLSNVAQYVLMSGGEASSKLFENLSRVPWEKNAEILFTADLTGKTPMWSQIDAKGNPIHTVWSYFAVTPKSFLHKLKGWMRNPNNLRPQNYDQWSSFFLQFEPIKVQTRNDYGCTISELLKRLR